MVAKWLERLAVNAKGLGWIPASYDTVESEVRQMKQCWITYKKNTPFKTISVLFRFASIFSLHFAYFHSFRFRFFLGQAIFRFIYVSLGFFRFFSLISRSFSLQIVAVSLRCETRKIMPFFRFQAKRNFRFNFNFRFRSENEGAPILRIHPYKIMLIRVRSASQVGKLLTNILLAVAICTLSPSIPFCFCYRMRRVR
jgi:hypothetical protein